MKIKAFVDETFEYYKKLSEGNQIVVEIMILKIQLNLSAKESIRLYNNWDKKKKELKKQNGE